MLLRGALLLVFLEIWCLQTSLTVDRVTRSSVAAISRTNPNFDSYGNIPIAFSEVVQINDGTAEHSGNSLELAEDSGGTHQASNADGRLLKQRRMANSRVDTKMETSSDFADRTLRGFSAPADTSTRSMSDMAATGANLARVFLTLNQRGDSYSIDASSLKQLDAVITAGAQLGFKVVICFSPPDNKYFSSSGLQGSIDADWQIIAKKYRGNLAVAGYELINEPVSPSPGGVDAWTALASQWITGIRRIDPSHVIIFEPTPGGIPEAFRGLKPLPFDNIVYSTHMYEPYQFTHQGILHTTSMSYPVTSSSIGPVNKTTVSSALQPVRDFVAAYNVPMFVGEFGAVRWAPNESSNTYISDLISLFEAEGYSWTYNSWRNYQGWDAELPESWFYGFPYNDAKPQGFATVWPPPHTSNTDTMTVLRSYFIHNAK